MSKRTQVALAMAFCLLAAPVALSAQEISADVQALIRERQEVELRLMPLQQKALEDSALSSEQGAVGAAVRKAMVAADPAMEAKLARFDAILVEGRAAQQSGDSARVVALITEARDLQPQIEAAQARALEQPDINAQVLAFSNKVDAKIVALDPSAQQLLDRRRELDEQIRKAVSRE